MKYILIIALTVMVYSASGFTAHYRHIAPDSIPPDSSMNYTNCETCVDPMGIGGDLVGIAKGDPGNFWFGAGLDNEIYAYADYPGYWLESKVVNVTQKTGLKMIDLTNKIGADKFLRLVQHNCRK